jgi:aminopeptidase
VPSPFKRAELARYAEAMAHASVSIRRGDDLIVFAEPAHRELGLAIVEVAFRAGARSADVVYIDPRVRAARLRHAPRSSLGYVTSWNAKRFRGMTERTTATLFITGDSDSDALKGIDPARVVADATGPFRQLPWLRSELREGKRRWGIVGWPTEEWASRVYPTLAPASAARRLARDLLWFCRLGPDDPDGWTGLKDHLAAVQGRAKRLTKLGLRRLELRGPGTDLAVGIAPGSLFLGGGEKNAHGIHISPNLPTEENFTTPDARTTEGTFRCSRPLLFQGRLVEGIAGEFRGGRLVRLRGKGKNGEFFRQFIGSIENADRLGEVALVDSSSRIGRSGRIYYNTLLDENAAAHIAFGAGFGKTRMKAPSRGRFAGVNKADAHIDVMVGTDELEATGTDARGRRIPLIRDGAWQI